MSNRIFIVSLMRARGDTGLQAHVNSFFSYLDENEVPVQLVTPYDRGMWIWYPLFAFRYVIEWFSRPTSVLWYRYIRFYALKFRLKKLLRDKISTVLYAQCPVSAESCLRARPVQSQRVVMVAHFNVSQADEWVGQGYLQVEDSVWRAIRALEATVLPNLDGIVFVSTFTRDLILQRIPSVNKIRNKVIPNFVREPKSSCTRPNRDDAEFALLSIGTLEPRKNQQYLLEIVAMTRVEIPSLKLTIIGDGPDRQMLEQQVLNLGLEGCVNFRGKVVGAADLLPQFDAFIHVAKMESFGIVIIEAMAAGLPVFACPVGGVPEVFTNGLEGYFLPLDNAQEAAKILSKALKSNDHVAKLGKAARARFQATFDQLIVGKNLLDFLLLDDSSNCAHKDMR